MLETWVALAVTTLVAFSAACVLIYRIRRTAVQRARRSWPHRPPTEPLDRAVC